jgi:hypothetical protein
MISISPAQLIAHLRKTAPDAVLPAFEQAIDIVEKQLDDFANAATEAEERDYYDKDSITLHAAKRSLSLKIRNNLIEAIEKLGQSNDVKQPKLSLSLIADEQMQMTLACEKLVERFNHLHRKGVKALDMRLCKVFEQQAPLGVRMPLSPHVLADCARAGLLDVNLNEPTKAMVVQQYELFLDPILSDLLKATNASLAQAGVLPNLVVQDEEERIRRQSLTAAVESHKQKNSKLSIANENDAAPSHSDAALDAEDRALFAELLAQVKSQRASANMAPQISNELLSSALSLNLSQAALAPRSIAKSDTLSILNTLQHSNSQQIIDAITRSDGSIAETIKQEMVKNAQSTNSDPTEQVGLAQEEENAVDLAGNLFEMLLKDRQVGDAASPLLSRMMMPFVKAAVMDPQVFVERQHPARELLNTISEACEDNLGETPQDRELLSHVEKAVERINNEFTDDIGKFEDISQELSKQMEAHRKRVQFAEKRAADAQRGQERLEMARLQASDVVKKAKQEYDYPPELASFFTGAWQHHLSMTALRKGEDSDAYNKATSFAKHWTNLLDMLSLGEPLSASVIDTLQVSTTEVLSNSGIFDPEAQAQFKSLMDAVQRWSEPEPIAAAKTALENPASTSKDELPSTQHITEASIENSPTTPPMLETSGVKSTAQELQDPSDTTSPQTVLVQAPEVKAPVPTTAAEVLAQMANADASPITEAELNEMRALEVGMWLQIPKPEGGTQKLKIGWISGISGLMMMVNRRGARILALSPEELVRFKRRDELTIFEREAAVDQALKQLLNQYKKH